MGVRFRLNGSPPPTEWEFAPDWMGVRPRLNGGSPPTLGDSQRPSATGRRPAAGLNMRAGTETFLTVQWKSIIWGYTVPTIVSFGVTLFRQGPITVNPSLYTIPGSKPKSGPRSTLLTLFGVIHFGPYTIGGITTVRTPVRRPGSPIRNQSESSRVDHSTAPQIRPDEI